MNVLFSFYDILVVYIDVVVVLVVVVVVVLLSFMGVFFLSSRCVELIHVFKLNSSFLKADKVILNMIFKIPFLQNCEMRRI